VTSRKLLFTDPLASASLIWILPPLCRDSVVMIAQSLHPDSRSLSITTFSLQFSGPRWGFALSGLCRCFSLATGVSRAFINILRVWALVSLNFIPFRRIWWVIETFVFLSTKYLS